MIRCRRIDSKLSASHRALKLREDERGADKAAVGSADQPVEGPAACFVAERLVRDSRRWLIATLIGSSWWAGYLWSRKTGGTEIIHREFHRTDQIGWLRAAVLGANDGLISTSSLVVGVAAAQPNRAAVLLTAVAGLVAGALSMAAGEYVSVSPQADTIWTGTVRVAFWGAVAMGCTALVGRLFGTVAA